MSAAVAAALTFNLFCTGTMLTTQHGQPATTKFETLFVIDLKQGLWRQDNQPVNFSGAGCKIISHIKRATPYELLLEEGETKYFKVRRVINRTTGGLMQFVSGQNLDISDIGTCEKHPFTGFPKSKF